MEEVADELGLAGSRVGLGLEKRERTPGANEKKASETGGQAVRLEPDGCWP